MWAPDVYEGSPTIDELVLKSMYPLLQQWHRKLNIEYLYLSSKGLALLVEPCLIVFHHTALQEPTLDWTYTLEDDLSLSQDIHNDMMVLVHLCKGDSIGILSAKMWDTALKKAQ
ncbi:hypothetical protein Mapa_013704 [Marchantia paleacea]|nr:hypothetical protein Mapa_013704 [Marchantia paleacea]